VLWIKALDFFFSRWLVFAASWRRAAWLPEIKDSAWRVWR
jgi:hypothetical protein